MFERSRRLAVALLLAMAGVVPVSAQTGLPPVPQGIEVQARGPVHEAFASLAADPVPTKPIGKKPPAPIDELPPSEKPASDCIWISGYWAWDDDRDDFLWVSGLWRTVPPGKQWVAGYWREEGDKWQWVPGFWASAAKEARDEEQQVTYLPPPPPAPAQAPPPRPSAEDGFYVPGCYVWSDGEYRWRAGYWARVQPGYVWVPDHYRWTPSGYVFIPGYWDLAVARRGILYAPVVIRPEVVTVGFVYTPTYAVRDTVIVDALFVRPTTCHYYFGDYYEPRYRSYGFQSCVVYSQSNYDSIIVYERYERRRDPNWINVQINVYNNRVAGREPPPPRVINNTTIVNNYTLVAPTTTVIQNKNIQVVNIDQSTRIQARTQARVVQQVAQQRVVAERPLPPGAPRQARVASLSVPRPQPVKPGMVVPKPRPFVATPPRPAAPARPGVPAERRVPAPGKTGAPLVSRPGPPTAKPLTTGAPLRATPPVGRYPGTMRSAPVYPASRTGQPLTTTHPGTHPGTPGKPPVPGLAQPSRTPPPAAHRPPPPPPARRPPPPPPRDRDRDKDRR